MTTKRSTKTISHVGIQTISAALLGGVAIVGLPSVAGAQQFGSDETYDMSLWEVGGKLGQIGGSILLVIAAIVVFVKLVRNRDAKHASRKADERLAERLSSRSASVARPSASTLDLFPATAPVTFSDLARTSAPQMMPAHAPQPVAHRPAPAPQAGHAPVRPAVPMQYPQMPPMRPHAHGSAPRPAGPVRPFGPTNPRT